VVNPAGPRSILIDVRVADGIVRVDGLRVGNAYLVELDDGVLLVDTGIPGRTGHILRALTRMGHQPGDLRTIVLTHWHPDHMGNAAELRRETGTRIAIHKLDADILAGGERPAKGRRAMGMLLRVLRIKPLRPDLTIDSGDMIGGLEVIHAPGHTAGSIALRRRDGVLFTGDALLEDRRGRLVASDPGLSLEPEQARATATSLVALNAPLVLAGHGAVVRGHRGREPPRSSQVGRRFNPP
jgi:glyoxylase-like metal-dependent hydrolase (beta-lactamase superfamily II)